MDIYDNVISRFMAGGGGGGGGGGLPTPTTEGAVLEVGAVADPSVVILPEQTVDVSEYPGEYVVTALNEIENGTRVIITVNGESAETIAIVDEEENRTAIPYPPFGVDSELVWDGDDFSVFYDEGNLDGAPLTISVVGVKNGWVEDPYGAYDIVVKVDESNNLQNLTDDDIHLVKGTYNKAINKVEHGYPLSVLVYGIDTQNDETYYAQFFIQSVYADVGYHDTVEIRVFKSYEPQASVRDAGGTSSTTIYGAALDGHIVRLYISESGISVTPPWN